MRTAYAARWALFLAQAALPPHEPVGAPAADPLGAPTDARQDSRTDPAEQRLRGVEAPAYVYPWRGRSAWECCLPECGEAGAEDTPGDAGDAARRHLRDDHVLGRWRQDQAVRRG